MQFKVPQFLEIEDKIFGPFTWRQFVYLAGGAGLCFVLYRALGLGVALIPILGIGALAAALAFYRPNNKPFVNLIQNGFRYFLGNRLYVWKKEMGMEGAARRREKKEASALPEIREAKLSGSKLRDLAWSLDILDLKKGN